MNKIEILDKIIDLEDELESEALSQIPSKVISQIEKMYGQDGVSVANVYYLKNDKVSDDECPDCADKAKKLIEVMKTSQIISDSLNSEEVSKLCESISSYDNIIDKLNDTISVWKIMLNEDGIACNKKLLILCLIKFLILNGEQHG